MFVHWICFFSSNQMSAMPAKNNLKPARLLFFFALIVVLPACKKTPEQPISAAKETPTAPAKTLRDTLRLTELQLTGAIADTAIGGLLLQDAQMLCDSSQFPLALARAQKAEQIFVGHLGSAHLRVADAWLREGYCFREMAAFDSATIYLNRALKVRLAQLGEHSTEVAHVYLNIGLNAYYQGQFEEALKKDEAALQIFLSKNDSEQLNIARCYNNIGLIYQYKGDYIQAKSHHEKALGIRQRALKPTAKEIGASLLNIGLAASSMGHLDEALEYFHKSLAIFSLERKPSRGLAAVYNNIGLVETHQGHLDKALEYDLKTLEIERQVLSPQDPSLAITYHNIGTAYKDKKQYDEALVYFKKGLAMIDPANPDIAYFHNVIGFVLERKRNYREALSYYQKALDIRLKVFGARHALVATVFFNLASLHEATGNLAEALNFNRKALQALNYAAGMSFDQVSSPMELFDVLVQESRLQWRVFQKNDADSQLRVARGSYQTALQALDSIKNSFREPSTKQRLIASAYATFEGAIAANLALAARTDSAHYTRDAFVIAEQSKAFLLREAFGEAEARSILNLPESLRARELSLKIKIAQLEQERYSAQSGAPDEAAKDSIFTHYTSRIFDLKRSADSLYRVLEANHPDYFRLKYGSTVASVETVQKNILRPDQVLLEYFVGDSSIFVFVVRPADCRALEIKRDFQLDRLAKQMLAGIYAPFTHGSDSLEPTKARQQYTETAHTLYQHLVAPAAALIPKEASLLIVPDGPLSYLPFEALLNNTPAPNEHYADFSYLIKKHPISYAYSATLLGDMQQKQHGRTPRRQLLAVAPTFDGHGETGDTAYLASRRIDVSNRKNWLSPLLYNTEEADAVRQIAGGDIWKGPQATKTHFAKNAADYRILHLSTHGKANDESGDNSFLAFHPTKDSTESDLLYARELYNLPLNADLVVLSACETGIGEWQRGEGIISLSRGFSFAGAKSIITSLWSVNDRSTRDLMENFYRHLKTGVPKDVALRRAQLDYLAQSPNPEPYFWAGFIPVGDMSTVEMKGGIGIAIWLAAGIVALLFALWWWWKRSR